MNKYLSIIIIILTTFYTGISLAQDEYWHSKIQSRIVSIGAVIQNWSIDGEEHRLAEGTFPFLVNLF